MRKRNIILLVGFVSLALAGSVAAYVGKHKLHKGDYIKTKLANKLELSSTQSTKLEQVVDQFMQLREQSRTHWQDDVSDALDLLQSDSLDQTQALQIIRDRGQRIEQQATTMITTLAAFTDTLDATQKAELRQLIERRMEKRGRHGRWHRQKHDKRGQEHSESG